MPTLACRTLGCKVNQYDTEAMREILERAGYVSVSFEEDADVYLVNTCTVTGTGDAKSLKLIRRLHREHPRSAVIAAGCLAQRAPEKVLNEGALLAIGVQRRGEVAELLKQALETGRPTDATAPLKDAAFERLSVSRHEGKTRATMKIQEGCDRYCSYCIIPFVRGPVRSMPLADVRAEAARLAQSGYREIVVTGIHLASYGRENGGTLIDALDAAGNTPGVMRVRIGSLEPACVTDEFARALRQIPGICPQFHLSLQSGSDTVLKRMNRRYTSGEYLDACDTLRRYFPACAVTTDVITGFPGETDEEFDETLKFVKNARLARLHVFPYSRRSGTYADKLPGQVAEEVKKRRTDELIRLGRQLECEYVRGLIGTCQSVLFETRSEDGMCEGFTETYVLVRANAEPGELKKVFITGAQDNLCTGEGVK